VSAAQAQSLDAQRQRHNCTDDGEKVDAAGQVKEGIDRVVGCQPVEFVVCGRQRRADGGGNRNVEGETIEAKRVCDADQQERSRGRDGNRASRQEVAHQLALFTGRKTQHPQRRVMAQQRHQSEDEYRRDGIVDEIALPGTNQNKEAGKQQQQGAKFIAMDPRRTHARRSLSSADAPPVLFGH
jgi:hypothetical protein